MKSHFLAALLAASVLPFDAARAHDHGGYVVPDPYADLPPIQLQKPVPAPQYVPPAGAVPDRRAPTLDLGRALGIVVQDYLAQELDRVLPGARHRGERWGGERRYHDGGWRGRARDDDDDDDRDD